MSVAAIEARAVPTVATVGGMLRARVAGDCEFLGPRFASVEGLLAAPDVADAVILETSSAAQAAEWLVALRRDARYGLRPIFAREEHALTDLPLIDGAVASSTACYLTLDEISARVESLARDASDDPESRLLAFLFTRPGKLVEPVRDWRHPSLYRYPLLEVFDPDASDGDAWLESLARRKLIEPIRLHDRVRRCPSCRGAHLSYTDLCASCGSVDICEDIFLHCYTCGHVAEQASYLRTDGVQCPKCHARLRHIGVDYDRALETFSCATCGSRFAEPDIKARCMHCGEQHATTDLRERRIETYQLSASGALAARTGQVGELFSLIDGFNYAHPTYFERTLDWQIDLRRRHPEVQFGLICIELVNVRRLLDATTRARTAQLIDAFVARLRELVRATDLVCRTDESCCWLLLPQTPPQGLEVLRARIEELPRLTALDSAPALEIAVRAFASRDLGTGRIPAPLLMSELRGARP